MKLLTRLAALLLVAALPGALWCADQPEGVARSAALTWLTLVDAGDYAQSWATAAELFRNRIGRDAWVSRVSGLREPLGAVKSRELQSAKFQRSLAGAPDGEYVIVEYATRFEHKAATLETVVPMKDSDGHWHVSGYFLK